MVFLHNYMLGEPTKVLATSGASSRAERRPNAKPSRGHAGIMWSFCLSYLLKKANEVIKTQTASFPEVQKRKLVYLMFALPAGAMCALIGCWPMALWRVMGFLAPNTPHTVSTTLGLRH